MTDTAATRQFVAVTFRPGDRRRYTYHNDGPPVQVGDKVKAPDKSGDGWTGVEVVEIVAGAPKFATKGLLGKVEPVPASDLFPDGAAEQ